MRVKGLNSYEVIEIVDRMSADHYDGNVIIREVTDRSTSRTHHATFTIRVRDSRGPGARRSWQGRRTPSACWHAHWHLMDYLFARYPAAVVRTALATYTADTWRARAEGTRWLNVGSMMQPAYATELCECDDECDEFSDGLTAPLVRDWWAGMVVERADLSDAPTGADPWRPPAALSA